MGAWVIGHNLEGYSPESDTHAFTTWNEGANALHNMAIEYATTADEAAWNALDQEPADGEWPGMEGDVRAALADMRAAADAPDSNWFLSSADDSGHQVVFWLTWSEDRKPDTD